MSWASRPSSWGTSSTKPHNTSTSNNAYRKANSPTRTVAAASGIPTLHQQPVLTLPVNRRRTRRRVMKLLCHWPCCFLHSSFYYRKLVDQSTLTGALFVSQAEERLRSLMDDLQLGELPHGRIKAMARYDAVPSPPALLFPSLLLSP